MAMTGRAGQVKIKDENDSSNVQSYANARLQLTKKKSVPKISIKVPPDNETVFEFGADDCSFIDESSQRRIVECFRTDSGEKTVIILKPDEDCVELLNELHMYLENKDDRPRSPPPPPSRENRPKEPDRKPEPKQNIKVDHLIQALNSQKADKAAQLARELAEERQSIVFALDMINESGNGQSRPPPAPEVELLKLKLSIETFLIESCSNQQYDVAILPNTSIKDLKQLVRQQAGIEPNQQYWYINRDLLGDDYKFGASKTPRVVNEQTVLTLYIAKP